MKERTLKAIPTVVYGMNHRLSLGEQQQRQYTALISSSKGIALEIAGHSKKLRAELTALAKGNADILPPDPVRDPDFDSAQDMYERMNVVRGSQKRLLFPDLPYKDVFAEIDKVFTGEARLTHLAREVIKQGVTPEKFQETLEQIDEIAQNRGKTLKDREVAAVDNLVAELSEKPLAEGEQLALPWGMLHLPGLQHELSSRRDSTGNKLFDVKVQLEHPIVVSPYDRLEFYYRLGNEGKLGQEKKQLLLARSLCFVVLNELFKNKDISLSQTKERDALRKQLAKDIAGALSYEEIQDLVVPSERVAEFTTGFLQRVMMVMKEKKPYANSRSRGKEVAVFSETEEYKDYAEFVFMMFLARVMARSQK